jgi:hypothetical protein
MNRSLLVPLLVLAFVLATARPAAAQEAATPPSPDARAASPPPAPDARQAQLTEAYRDLHAELRQEYGRLLANHEAQTLEWKRQRDERRSRTKHTGGYRAATMKLKSEQEAIESRIKALEGRREALKAEVATQHGGRVPPYVAAQWSGTDAEHAAFLKDHAARLERDLAERTPH